MSWVTKTLSSTIGRKLIMALTGLFLILFLTGHVSGNLLLFKDDGGEAFNIYAKFMTTNPAVKLLSYLTYISIIGHVVFSIWLSRRNKAARPVGYGVSTPPSTTLSSRNMGILGTIILIFIVVHMQSFWAQMHWGDLPVVTYEGEQYKDLFSIVSFAFQNELMVIGYVVAMAFLAFHLSHGFASAFQTLGLNHAKYSPAIAVIGKIYCILVPILFASMPVYIYFTQS
ncbi:succinate dehydrogenase / fumarate reductase cytochrome b subunit [Algoriphagus locisalis]|uniref:Succinate dehydrogenase / fumarate reductase cytochrome b subunit n=1 Tax=Algoriphagus locisalis TaxID=305507 RepID=A0A1I7CH21_9BACT|nr:succinate dehydrogenase cytochrome b subunit [Algoriphagus locisalis]SFT98723.1 succinate dehydrogenase / fumarate reductase cytochrome b subunit [Algoriphagus locisalis]